MKQRLRERERDQWKPRDISCAKRGRIVDDWYAMLLPRPELSRRVSLAYKCEPLWALRQKHRWIKS
eukprot:5590805-Amphidinium_carterae.2